MMQNDLLNSDIKQIQKEKDVLVHENEGKQDYLEMVHQLCLKGSVQG